MSAAWDVSLPRFEGPLDLLLSLVKRNQFDLADFPLAEITTQYLDYVQEADKFDLNLSSDFAYMAATLIQLKSASLLPRDPEIATREVDPREDLVRRLFEHEQARTAAEFLKQRLEIAEVSWSRSTGDWMNEAPESTVESSVPANGSLNLLDVVRLAKKALAHAQAHQSFDLDPAGITVEEMMDFLSKELSKNICVPGDILFAAQHGKDRQSMLFLALLELAKVRKIHLQQDVPFAEWTVTMAQVCQNERERILIQ